MHPLLDVLTSFVISVGNNNVPVYTYIPQKMHASSQVVFIMHGAKRNSLDYLEPWILYADKYNLVLVSPEFSQHQFDEAFYQRGNLLGPDDKFQAKEQWSFSVIESIFARVKWLYHLSGSSYNMYGHSGGAQFIHRMILFMPEANINIAIAANSGWYTIPLFEEDFPYGLKGSSATPESLSQSLHKKLIIVLGENDTDRNATLMRRDEQSDKQGQNRLERGKYFYNIASSQANGNFRWKLVTIPGVAHDHKQITESLESSLGDTLFNGDCK